MRSNSFFASFTHAFAGLAHAIQAERNMKFHIISAIVVLVLASFLQLNIIEWILIILLITGVIVLELLNTVVERAIDIVKPDFHPLAKQAKDVAAAAVLVFAVASAIIGILIFLPKMMTLLY